MMMYLALQTAPFEDLTTYTTGLTEEYFTAEQWSTRQQYILLHHTHGCSRGKYC